ncbi:TniQ family protein [Streptomyces sp. NPDC048342]|uniref:TniQ family protein n=1 Tax=unclassified Streptomyces TaxID=2593676 RepID=UPI0034377C97
MGASGLPRRLPAVLVPVDGESFASWLSRAAADWQLAPGEAAQAVGLECHPGYSVVRPLFFGIALTERSLARVEAATGIDAQALRAMQLSRYATSALDFTGLNLASEASLTALGHREWALFTSSRACPTCLAARPVWPLWWRLGIAAVCPVHQVLLVDVCRRCGIRLGRGYTGHPRGLITRRQEVDLGRCNNRRPATRRRKAGLCDQNLAVLPAVPVPAALAALQQRVLDIADGRASARVAGVSVAPAEFFAALRFTAALVRLVATADDLAACTALPGDAAERFAADQHGRQQASRGGAGTQLRASPPGAAHAAAVLALTEPALFAPDRHTCQEVLSAWMGRAVARRRTPGKSDPLRVVPRPACLEPLVRAAAPPSSRIAGALAVRPAARPSFTTAHLPHLVDADDYTELLAAHLPGTAPVSGRRLAALALARIAGAASWQQAAADLAMDPLKAARATNTLVQRITDPDAFWRATEQSGVRLHERGLVDYAARRRKLAGLTAVPHAVLYPVCRPLEHDVTLQRRRHAAAWVWQHFTAGDVREAPAYGPGLWTTATTESVREGWRRFAAWIPDTVAAQLTAFGRDLLDPDATGGA